MEKNRGGGCARTQAGAARRLETRLFPRRAPASAPCRSETPARSVAAAPATRAPSSSAFAARIGGRTFSAEMDHDPYFDPPPSGGEDHAARSSPPPHRFDDPPPLPPGAGPAPGDRVGSKRQRSPPRYDRHDRVPHHLGHPDLARDRDRSPRRRRFDGPPGGGFHEGRRVVVRGRGRGRGPARDDEPLSFREFCVRHVSDAATPAEAERRYEQYKQEHAEAFRRRDFERGARDDPEIRAAHDPRAIEEAISRRAEMARDAARAFQSDLEAGKVAPLPPAAAVPAPAENAILPAGAPEAASSDEQRRSFVSKKDARGRWPVPAVAWAPERLRRDLRVLTTLVAALDAEKGVDGSSMVPRAAEPPESALDDGGERKTADDVFGDAASVAKALDVRDTEAPRGLEDVEHETENSALIDALAHAVDRRVYYLWLVHGVDYYAGAELSAGEYAARPPSSRAGEGEGVPRARRAARRGGAGGGGARVRGGGAGSEAGFGRARGRGRTEAASEDASAEARGRLGGGDAREAVRGLRLLPANKWASRVDRCWRARLEQGDASAARAGRDVVERELEAWKQSCVVRHEENRFGCTLSSKMFVASEFVLKHIEGKQAEAVAKARDAIIDRLFLENYLAARREGDKSAKAREKRARRGEARAPARRRRRRRRGAAGRAAKQENARARQIHREGQRGARQGGGGWLRRAEGGEELQRPRRPESGPRRPGLRGHLTTTRRIPRSTVLLRTSR